MIHTQDNAYTSREKYLLSVDVGKTYLKKFKSEVLNLYEKYSLQLGNIFELNWGYGAIHSGRFPTDWVKSSEMEEDGYSKTTSTILSSMYVLERDE